MHLLPSRPSALLPRLAAAAAAGLLLAAVGIARAASPAPPRYTAVDLGALPGESAWVTGINSAGQVTGVSFSSIDGETPYRPVLFSGGSVTYLNSGGGLGGIIYDINSSGVMTGAAYQDDRMRSALWSGSGSAGPEILTQSPPPAWPYSAGYAINDAGLIVGQSRPGAMEDHAVSWKDNTITDLHPPGARWSKALGVNSSGAIAGSYLDRDGHERAAMWRNGVLTDLGGGGSGSRSGAVDINDAGWVVGYSAGVSGANEATLWRDGAAINLGAPVPGAASQAYGMNAAGDVIGVYGVYPADPVPFLYKDGVMYDFRSLLEPGSPVTEFYLHTYADINDAGQFAGAAVVNGQLHAFLFTPVNVPEPSAAGLAVCALTGALVVRRSRKRQDAP